MKTKLIKFVPHLIPLVLSGEKTSTWRLFDDKDLLVGDNLILINKATGEEFAKARIVKVNEKSLGELTNDDFDGHEKFESPEIMLDTYRGYYGEKVDVNSVVKMIDFILQDKI